MDEQEKEALEALQEMETYLGELETYLEPFTRNKRLDLTALSEKQRASLEIGLAFAESVLYSTFLLLNGSENGEVESQKERIQASYKRLLDVSGASKPKTRINVEASDRVIRHGLSGDINFGRDPEEVRLRKEGGGGGGKGKSAKKSKQKTKGSNTKKEKIEGSHRSTPVPLLEHMKWKK